ncbi:MAG: MATE family efflux transporter [Clostridia bacterium]|nr:MATE family efflux transporter [Clostridia bacterium]
MNTQIRDFTKGNIVSQLIRFTLPLLLSNLLQVVYNMVDMVIVGHQLGDAGISAVAVGGDVSHFLTFIAMGFSNAGQVLIAKYVGANRKDQISRFVGTMSSFLLVCSLAISITALLLRHSILTWMNTPSEAYNGAMSYSVISACGLLFIYGYNIVSAVLRGMGDSKHPFIFISIAAVLNVILDLLFVVVLPYGAGGAAFATVISQGVSFLVCTVFLFRHKQAFALEFRLKEYLQWDKQMLWSLIKLGVPMAIKTASIQVSKLFVNAYVNGFGVAVSAFSGIANKIANITNLISAAMNTAGSTMVGQNIAAKQYNRVKKIMLTIGGIAFGVSTFFALIFIFTPPHLLFSVFTKDEAVLAIAVEFLPIALLLFLGSAMRAVMNALLNGSGHTKINFATAILDGIVMRIGLSLLFGKWLNMGYFGFWLGDALAGFTPFFIGAFFYWSGAWKKGEP